MTSLVPRPVKRSSECLGLGYPEWIHTFVLSKDLDIEVVCLEVRSARRCHHITVRRPWDTLVVGRRVEPGRVMSGWPSDTGVWGSWLSSCRYFHLPTSDMVFYYTSHRLPLWQWGRNAWSVQNHWFLRRHAVCDQCFGF